MKDITVLKRARAFLLKPGGWTKGRLARDKKGREVPVTSRRAVSFCAVGAICRVLKIDSQILGQGTPAHDLLLPGTGETFVVDFNDKKGRTQAQVLKAFDRAIAKLEAQ